MEDAINNAVDQQRYLALKALINDMWPVASSSLPSTDASESSTAITTPRSINIRTSTHYKSAFLKSKSPTNPTESSTDEGFYARIRNAQTILDTDPVKYYFTFEIPDERIPHGIWYSEFTKIKDTLGAYLLDLKVSQGKLDCTHITIIMTSSIAGPATLCTGTELFDEIYSHTYVPSYDNNGVLDVTDLIPYNPQRKGTTLFGALTSAATSLLTGITHKGIELATLTFSTAIGNSKYAELCAAAERNDVLDKSEISSADSKRKRVRDDTEESTQSKRYKSS